MIARLIALILAAALSTQAMAEPSPDPRTATAAALRDKALGDPLAYELVSSLATQVGARPAGSAAAAKARDWAVAQLTRLGFQNIQVEPFAITAWTRGREEAEITAPERTQLTLLGLGGAAPTPPGGVEGEIAVFHSFAELTAAPSGSLAGKIALIDQAMPRTRDAAGYSLVNRGRMRGAQEAGKRGAAAFLVRSTTTASDRIAHTGAAHFDGARIPAAAVSPPDAEHLAALAAKGPVRVRLVLESAEAPATAWTVSGEITGSERPDEIVAIGGHLDSWDVGQGAIDDGVGVAISTSAAHLISQLPRRPRRTIRVVLFGAEEMDFSRKAYASAHAAEAPRMVVASEADAGADALYAIALPRGAAAAPQLQPLAGVLEPLNVVISPDPARETGADFASLQQQGVPVIDFKTDLTRYFDWHHSSQDILDKVDRASLAQNVAAWAAVIYLIADSDIDFRALR